MERGHGAQVFHALSYFSDHRQEILALIAQEEQARADSAGLEARFVRLYPDRPIMTRLAVDLRGRGYHVVATQEVPKNTACDDEQLGLGAAAIAPIAPGPFGIRAGAFAQKQRLRR